MENFRVLSKSPRPPMGYRLATVQEAAEIHNWDKLVNEDVEVVRLLDGSLFIPNWRYAKPKPKVRFKETYGHMLVVKANNNPGTSVSDGLLRKKLYSECKLTAEGRKAALLFSCQDENTEVIYWLLKENEDANAFDKSEWYSLINSVNDTFPDAPDAPRKPYVKIIEKLLNFKFKEGCPSILEESDKDGKTLLHYAVELDYQSGELDKEENAIAVAEFLLEESSIAGKKRMVNSKDSNGKTPLLIAMEGKKFGIFTKLFYLSVSPNDYIQDNITGLKLDGLSDRLQMEAARRGYTQTVVTLIEKCNLYPTKAVGFQDGKTLLHYVADWDDADAALEVVTSLLMKKWSERTLIKMAITCDKDRRTVLHLASRRGHVNLCMFFTKHKSINVDVTDQYGQTSLHLAAKGTKNNEQLVDLLVGNDAGIIYLKDNKGRTPLHIAATVGNSSMVKKLIFLSKDKKKEYVRAGDFWGQTALHKAVYKGHIKTTYELLRNGSRPLVERDSDGKTPLHYASQGNEESTATILIMLLLKISQMQGELSLLLWASPSSIGTAAECAKLPKIKEFLRKQIKGTNLRELLRKTARQGNLEMAMELVNRSADINAILDSTWRQGLQSRELKNVERVVTEITNIPGRVTDQPAVHDNLGRNVFAEGLAALFLNPHVKSPVTIGISGEWGTGKSSLMIQTEDIILKTAAQLTLSKMIDSKDEEDPMSSLLKEHPKDHHAILKSLAVMDRSQLFAKDGESPNSYTQGERLRTIPAILTVRYNAWQYRNEDEAWAGLAVAITKEIENAMTPAQWLCGCLKYTWTTARDRIWLELILPGLLAIISAALVAWAAWILLSRSTHRPLQDLKYGSIPVTVITIVWTVMKSAMSVVKPVSDQMREYMKLPDHTDKLGYQHKVIDDIKFLKQEITRAPSRFYASIAWGLNWFGACGNNVGDSPIPKMRPAFGDNLRIIAFVDDLDRCEHTVILKVLSAVNLVLAVCEINVILAMDKKMIEQAIRRKYKEDEEIARDVADKYMRKIFQLPLCLPDPSDMESQHFLNQQLGISDSANQETNKADGIEQEQEIAEWEQFDDLFKALNSQPESVKAYDFIHKAPKETDENPQKTQNTEIKIVNRVPHSDDGGNKSLQGGQSDSTRAAVMPMFTLPNYSAAERDTLNSLRAHATGSRKVPREWKRFLYYHRLAWNILSKSDRVKLLPRYQVQLVVWIFVCWEWRLPMNTLIQNWHHVAFSSETGKSSIVQDEYETDGEGPSLKEIVMRCYKDKWAEHCIDAAKNDTGEPDKKNDTAKRRDTRKPDKKDDTAKRDTGKPEKKDDKGTKDTAKLDKNDERETWERLIILLSDYNVSMDAILAFQQFRFECEIGNLTWPLPLLP